MAHEGSSRLSVVSGSIHYFSCFKVVACLPRSPVVCSWAHGLITRRLLWQRKGVLGMADELSGISMNVSFSGVCDGTPSCSAASPLHYLLDEDDLLSGTTKMLLFSLSVTLAVKQLAPPKLGTADCFSS